MSPITCHCFFALLIMTNSSQVCSSHVCCYFVHMGNYFSDSSIPISGWSHFAQFTIAVGNMDPKKIKYSGELNLVVLSLGSYSICILLPFSGVNEVVFVDTLHRFWKKEHDWGWKKFMELSKIQDGFLVDDVLEIIAQVQVIR